MKVTSVEPQVKHPSRFNIYLDDKFAFGADEDLVVNFRLVPGKIVEEKDLERLLFETQVGKLMARMYGLFNIRQRSEKEVRNYFKIKNFQAKIKEKEEISELAIENLIEKLKQKGLINDLEFAKAWVESRSKKKGGRAIRGELIQKGIGREIIDQVLEEGGGKEEKVAQEVLLKKMKSLSKLPALERKQKAIQFLLRRGFGYSLAQKVVSSVIPNVVRNL